MDNRNTHSNNMKPANRAQSKALLKMTQKLFTDDLKNAPTPIPQKIKELIIDILAALCQLYSAYEESLDKTTKINNYLDPDISVTLLGIYAGMENGRIYIGLPSYYPGFCNQIINKMTESIIKVIKNEKHHNVVTANGTRPFSIIFYDTLIRLPNYTIAKISDDMLNLLALNISRYLKLAITLDISKSEKKEDKLQVLTLFLNNMVFRNKDLINAFPILKVYDKNIRSFNEIKELKKGKTTWGNCLMSLQKDFNSIQQKISQNIKKNNHINIKLDMNFSSQWVIAIARITVLNKLENQEKKLCHMLDWVNDSLIKITQFLEDYLLLNKNGILLKEACTRFDAAFCDITIHDQIMLLHGADLHGSRPDLFLLDNVINDSYTRANELKKQIECFNMGLIMINAAKDQLALQCKEPANVNLNPVDEKFSLCDEQNQSQPHQQYVNESNVIKQQAQFKILKDQQLLQLRANRSLGIFSTSSSTDTSDHSHADEPAEKNNDVINLVITIKEKNPNAERTITERQVCVFAYRLANAHSIFIVCEDILKQRETEQCKAFLEICKRDQMLKKKSLGKNGIKKWGDSDSYVVKSLSYSDTHLVLNSCTIKNFPHIKVLIPGEIIDHKLYDSLYQNEAGIKKHAEKTMQGVIVNLEHDLTCKTKTGLSLW